MSQKLLPLLHHDIQNVKQYAFYNRNAPKDINDTENVFKRGNQDFKIYIKAPLPTKKLRDRNA